MKATLNFNYDKYEMYYTLIEEAAVAATGDPWNLAARGQRRHQKVSDSDTQARRNQFEGAVQTKANIPAHGA